MHACSDEGVKILFPWWQVALFPGLPTIHFLFLLYKNRILNHRLSYCPCSFCLCYMSQDGSNEAIQVPMIATQDVADLPPEHTSIHRHCMQSLWHCPHRQKGPSPSLGSLYCGCEVTALLSHTQPARQYTIQLCTHRSQYAQAKLDSGKACIGTIKAISLQTYLKHKDPCTSICKEQSKTCMKHASFDKWFHTFLVALLSRSWNKNIYSMFSHASISSLLPSCN